MIRFDWLVVYWWLLFGGLGMTLIYILIGELFEGFLEGLHFVNPTLLFAAISIVGGIGVLLSKYTNFQDYAVLIISILVGIIVYIVAYYFIILPLNRAEVSTAFSVKELEGSIAEVITSIPSNGYGEVIVSTIGGVVNYAAKSFDGHPIPNGARVVVVQAEKDHVLVTTFDQKEDVG